MVNKIIASFHIHCCHEDSGCRALATNNLIFLLLTTLRAIATRV